MPKVALLSALFFVGTFIHVPIGVTNVHLLLNGLVGAMLGARAFLAILIALIFQAALMGYGGFSSLGANLFSMAAPALISGFIFQKALRCDATIRKALFFACGFISVLLSVAIVSLFLYFSGEEFLQSAKILFFASFPLAFIEGGITMLSLIFIQKTYPEVLDFK